MENYRRQGGNLLLSNKIYGDSLGFIGEGSGKNTKRAMGGVKPNLRNQGLDQVGEQKLDN